MFQQKQEGYEGTTVIAAGVNIEGNFKGDGPMVIDGNVHGTISTTKSIEVGESAQIEANIRAASATIAGFIKGNIVAKERLELLPSSRVEGDITTKQLIISEGALLNGKCNMGDVTPHNNQTPTSPTKEKDPTKNKTATKPRVS